MTYSTKDRAARTIAALALATSIAAVGGFTYGQAKADSLSEPDAYQLKQVVQQQQESIDILESNVVVLNGTLDAVVDAVNEQSASTGGLDCLAFSDYHYYKETVDGSRKRYRLPVMVWNTSLRSCRFSDAPWHPKHRQVLLAPRLR